MFTPPSPAFVNRGRELASLEQSYASGQAELYVLYGRRRIGKTELLRTFCQGKPHIFFIGDLGTEAGALADFTRQVSTAVFGRPDAIGPFPSWDSALAFVAQQARTDRLVVVLDEFTYLTQTTPALPSILQKAWDAALRHTRVMLVLCSSYVGLMQKQVLAYGAPLYGRRAAQWHLQPLTFPDARQFFPAYAPEDQVRAYAVLGGVPAYLRQFTDRLSVLDNIEQRILTIGTYLYEEPRLLLLQELTDPSRYFSILEAIANKRTRVHEIAQTVGLPDPSLPFYLGTLRELGLIERVVPVTAPHPERSKRGSYRIQDHFFRFWFSFIYPNRSLLGRGDTAPVRRQVAASLDDFASYAFEAVCHEHMWWLAQRGSLEFVPQAVGSWWASDAGEQIDVVALGEGAALLGECKWSNRPVGPGILEELLRKAEALRRDEHFRRWNVREVRYALFSRSGFTPELQRRAAAAGIRLVDLAELGR